MPRTRLFHEGDEMFGISVGDVEANEFEVGNRIEDRLQMAEIRLAHARTHHHVR